MGFLKCNGYEMLARIKCPTVVCHLDLYWGLSREPTISYDPFWRARYCFSADGGNDEKFKALGINHFWFKPGVLKRECYLAEPRDDLRVDVGFVGSYHYHKEAWRTQLIDWLTATYKDKFRLFGASGDSWRGDDLNRLYASIACAVGDSCNVGFKQKKYCSDRLFEAGGRGAAQIFPRIEGIDNSYTDPLHLRWYEHGNFADLKCKIDQMVALPDDQRLAMRRAAVAHTIAHHTYSTRMTELLETVAAHEPAIAERLRA
jgi:hypothetical protein